MFVLMKNLNLHICEDGQDNDNSNDDNGCIGETPYASSLAFELFEDTTTNIHWVSLSLNGKFYDFCGDGKEGE